MSDTVRGPQSVSGPPVLRQRGDVSLLVGALIAQGSAAAKYKKLKPCSSFRADEIRACSGKSGTHTPGRARHLNNPTNKVRVEWLRNTTDSKAKTSQRAPVRSATLALAVQTEITTNTGITRGSDLEREEKTGLNESGQNLGHGYVFLDTLFLH